MYILQGGVRWFANCGFSFRSSVSFGQKRSPIPITIGTQRQLTSDRCA